LNLYQKKIKEPEFWKNYFYRIQLIREAMGLNKLDLISLPITKEDEFMQIQEIEVNNQNNNIKENNEMNEHENVSIFEQSQATSQQIQQTLSQHSSPRPPKDQVMDNNNNNTQREDTSSPFAVIDNDKNNAQNLNSNQNNNNLITGNGHIKDNEEKHIGNGGGEEEVEYFASDDPHIDHLSDEQKIKMKQELGLHNHNPNLHDQQISEKHDSHEMDALLADVEGVSDISEGELENVVNEVNDM